MKPKKKIIFLIAVIMVAALIISLTALVLQSIYNKDEVTIRKISFIDEGEDVYMEFIVNNPANISKTCMLEIAYADKTYTSSLSIDAQTKKTYKTLVDMPYGRTKVKLDYICR